MDLEALLSSRLELSRKEREGLREALLDSDGKIKILIASLAKTGSAKDTEEKIELAQQQLEISHATHSQSSLNEREFMREREKLRQKKASTIKATKMQQEIDLLRTTRTTTLQDLREKVRLYTLYTLYILYTLYTLSPLYRHDTL
jgi:hypothetical protein